MRIAVIGAGAMGSIYGGHLSQHNDVLLVDTNEKVVEQVANNGLLIDEDGTTHTYHPGAVSNTKGQEPADLVILFVKALFSRAALEGNRGLIGPNTRLMTLQNGAGHEDLLKEFVDEDHIVIGTTEDNGAVLGMGHVRRGGTGVTNVGMLVEDKEGFLPQLKEAFDQCGFNVKIHENIQTLIWDKLFTNVSLSALTGVLQVDMGYIAANEYAWDLCCQLIHETVKTAAAAGLNFDEEKVREKVKDVTITSDFIAGFPGETEEQFVETLTAMDELELDYSNTAAYSPREKTVAAKWVDKYIDEDTKTARLARLNEGVRKNCLKSNQKYIGREMEVLIENFENHKGKNVITGRTRNNKIVHIPCDTDRTGEFVNVKITGAKTWYLNGEVI